MGYMIDKEVLFIFGIPIYLAVVGIKVFLKKRKGKEVVFIRELVKFGFNIYIFALIGVTLFPLEIRFGEHPIPTFSPAINYMPFRSIIKDMSNIGQGHFSAAFQVELLIRNVGGNFILLMSLGFLTPVLWEKVNSVKKSLVIGFLVSLSIELLQLLEGALSIAYPRVVDVDDIILNTLGAAVGYIIYTLVNTGIKRVKISTMKSNLW